MYLKKIDSTKLSLDEKYEKIDELNQLVIELTNKTASLEPKCGKLFSGLFLIYLKCTF